MIRLLYALGLWLSLAQAVGAPLQVGLTWDSLPTAADGPDPRLGAVMRQIDINGQFDKIQDISNRRADYDERFQRWWSGNSMLLTPTQRADAQATYKKNLTDYDASRDAQREGIVTQIVDFAGNASRLVDTVQAGLSSVFGKRQPSANPFGTTEARTALSDRLNKLYLARVMLEHSLAKTVGRDVRVSFLPSAAELAEAAKKKGAGHVDLALLTGNSAAWTGADRTLKPLAVGGRNAAEIKNGIETHLVLNRNHPALKALDQIDTVLAAKPASHTEHGVDVETARRRDDAAANALVGNRDIAGWAPLPGDHADLNRQRDDDMARLYEKYNKLWQAKNGRAAEQAAVHQEFLAEHAKVERYYRDLVDRAVLNVSDRGMKKLLEQLACQPLALDEPARAHRHFALEQMLAHAGMSPGANFTSAELKGNYTAYEETASNPDAFTVADTGMLRSEQRNRYGMYKYGFVVVKNKDFSPPIPASGLWYDPSQLDAATATAVQRGLTAPQTGGRPVLFGVLGQILGTGHWEAPPADYSGQLTAFREKFPDASTAPKLRTAKAGCQPPAKAAPIRAGEPNDSH